jgi:heat shock protein HtpX
MMLALVVAVGMNFFSYWFSDQIVLKMYKAREVDDSTAPQFVAMVRELSTKAGIPMPKVYLIDEDAPNAFATGRNPEHAAVAATTGIIRVLSARELRGVMAHELAHVKHRDILISTISATMAGAIGMLANFAMFFGGRGGDGQRSNPIASIAVALLAPLAASLIQMAISRAREFEADRGGAEISGDPAALASALDKIHRFAQGLPMEAAERHPETAQMMIMNPLSAGGLRGLFSTHPPTEERVAALMALAQSMAQAGGRSGR